MVTLLITYYTILLVLKITKNSLIPLRKKLLRTPFNIEFSPQQDYVQQKLEDPNPKPLNALKNTKDEITNSNPHYDCNIAGRHFKPSLFFSQTPSRTLPRVISQVVVGLSRTQEPTSQVVEPLPLFIEFSEAESKPPKELHQSTTGNKEQLD
ncbi:hypothetical protein Glove_65g3 [Diversispora epigaea]|uniref:Uncharacterized protein n=1 Tax=Diversispora epigaea TaxID=1348612 RepID=A0A397JFC4_9GLOM|nr:hypothetical protein Glove_65g3 [Diversispora epigaea]